ncbi:MAG: DMT family transporter [Bacillota bacterium]
MAYLQIILAMVIWGSVGIFARFIPFSSKIIVFYRVFFAFISLAIYLIIKKDIKIDLKENNLKVILLAGVFLALNWLFFFKAIKTTTIAKATISYYTSPIILNILAIIILKEKLKRKTLISLILGFLGMIFIIYNGKDLTGGQFVGILYGLTAAFFYAFFSITNKKINNLGAIKATFIQSGVATISFIPFILPITVPDLKSIFLLLVMGILHTALALILYLSGLKKIKAQDVGVLSYVDPLSAVLLAALLLGEIPTILTTLGAVLVLLSGYILMKN